MRLLLVHNRYQWAGGEDGVFEAERDLLRGAGHAVSTLEASNSAIRGFGGQVASAIGAIYSLSGRRLMRQAIARERPEIVHVHNFFPLLSPSIFDACADAGVPTVWTLHNFRVACANGVLLRDGRPCEDCVGRFPWAAIRHRCYRDSLPGSLSVAAMIGWHSLANTWNTKVTRFIALTDFAREIFIRAGLPAEKIVVKPNFIQPPTATPLAAEARKGFAFVGRLSPEKGVRVLLDAWQACDLPLTIVGDGPLMPQARQAAAQNPAIRVLGQLSRDGAHGVIGGVKALIMPSICYESFPLAAVEAMALKAPVIASKIGALANLIVPGANGLHFQAGDHHELKAVAQELDDDNDLFLRLWRSIKLRDEFTQGPNLATLLNVYQDAKRSNKSSGAPGRRAGS